MYPGESELRLPVVMAELRTRANDSAGHNRGTGMRPAGFSDSDTETAMAMTMKAAPARRSPPARRMAADGAVDNGRRRWKVTMVDVNGRRSTLRVTC
jgi:hypothetical protein